MANPNYWWYTARAQLLRTVLAPLIEPGARVLDVGSADGPSVEWIAGRRVAVDIDLSALQPGGVCASALDLPFPDGCFDAVCAFDVIEHFADEDEIVDEITRVLSPGGHLLVSVPAYQWAWSPFDVQAGHFRRYTRSSITRALRRAGLRVERSTYAFLTTLPFFLLDRLAAKLARRSSERVSASRLPGLVTRILLALTRIDRTLLRYTDLPAGSSVFVAARKL